MKIIKIKMEETVSKNTKRVLIILIVAVIFCIVGGAVAIGGIGLLADRFAKNNVADTPEKVRQMAHEFINYELPSGYIEKKGIDALIYKMVFIGDDSTTDLISTSKPIIFLMNFQGTNGMTPEQMTEQMQKSVEQQNGQKGTNLKLVETRKVTINGHETTLNVSEGEYSSGGGAYRQWVTTFPGKTGLVILMIQGQVDDWDDAVFNEFLASLGS
jgi:hypothetical protein